MMKFRSLTNVRPTKDLGCQIICAPTEGQFKVTPEAAKVLGVGSGSYLQLVIDDETEIAYAVKGEEGLGGKLAASNKTGGGILTLSAAAAWDEMKGDANFNTHYSISADDVTILDHTEEEAVEVEVEGENTRTYFPLTFVEKTEKQSRKKSADAGETDDAAAPVEEAFEEM